MSVHARGRTASAMGRVLWRRAAPQVRSPRSNGPTLVARPCGISTLGLSLCALRPHTLRTGRGPGGIHRALPVPVHRPDCCLRMFNFDYHHKHCCPRLLQLQQGMRWRSGGCQGVGQVLHVAAALASTAAGERAQGLRGAQAEPGRGVHADEAVRSRMQSQSALIAPQVTPSSRTANKKSQNPKQGTAIASAGIVMTGTFAVAAGAAWVSASGGRHAGGAVQSAVGSVLKARMYSS